MQQGSRPQNIARYRTGNGQQPNLMTALQPLMNFIYQYPTLIVAIHYSVLDARNGYIRNVVV